MTTPTQLCRYCSDPNCSGCGDETQSKEHVLDISTCLDLDVSSELKVQKKTNKNTMEYSHDKKISNTALEIMSINNLYEGLKQTSHNLYYK